MKAELMKIVYNLLLKKKNQRIEEGVCASFHVLSLDDPVDPEDTITSQRFRSNQYYKYRIQIDMKLQYKALWQVIDLKHD